MAQDFYVDLHCHPSVKPFGRAYPGNTNNRNSSQNTSIWHYDPPTWLDKIFNKLFSVAKFSQSNFTALNKGNVKVAIVAVAPIEKGFFTSRPGSGKVADCVYNFVTEIGKKKIKSIQTNNNYFRDLRKEYKFYKQVNGTVVTINGQDHRYKLTRNYSDIINNLRVSGVISVVLSFEGGHVFNPDSNRRAKKSEILHNIDKVKAWRHLPLFVSLAHHFYNGFGGHARSLSGITGKAIDQSFGLNTGITALGKKVIKRLLDSTNGSRIYIDIKHMSRKLRMDYYRLLETTYREEDIPIIVSHGALNGYPSVYDDDCPNKDEHGPFWGRDINFYDDEILKITRSNGIFGLQLDDRVITNKKHQRKIIKFFYTKEKKLRLRASLVWNHIQHIAELLDKNDLDAWGTTAIGTDFDGIVDPPFGYWTSEYLPLLYKHLLEYAHIYMQPGNNTLRKPVNKSFSPNQILDRIFSKNAMNFLSRYY
jgi:microsomal dipeptidase-like Zn-dependent dipeptidase